MKRIICIIICVLCITCVVPANAQGWVKGVENAAKIMKANEHAIKAAAQQKPNHSSGTFSGDEDSWISILYFLLIAGLIGMFYVGGFFSNDGSPQISSHPVTTRYHAPEPQKKKTNTLGGIKFSDLFKSKQSEALYTPDKAKQQGFIELANGGGIMLVR